MVFFYELEKWLVAQGVAFTHFPLKEGIDLILVPAQVELYCVTISAAKHAEQEGLFFQKLKQKSELASCIIWEDIWLKNAGLVQARLRSVLGKTTTLYARLTESRRIDKPRLDQFLKDNHLFIPTMAKYKYGLWCKGELVAVASFSGKRKFAKEGKQLNSFELIRFCNKRELTVVGGLSKLIAHFVKEHNPGNIMTYVDLDWSEGKSFIKLGFSVKEVTVPMQFYVDPSNWNRIWPNKSENPEVRSRFPKVYNSGSLKLIKEYHTE